MSFLMVFVAATVKMYPFLPRSVVTVMSGSVNLARNQAVLWARDILARPDQFLIAVCDTRADGSPDDAGSFTLLTLNGQVVLTTAMRSIGTDGRAVLQAVTGKELVTTQLPQQLTQWLETNAGAKLAEFNPHYRTFASSDLKHQGNCMALQLGLWIKEALTTMASSSLQLDQADTGATRWTGAHFKPSPTVLDKLRTFLQS